MAKQTFTTGQVLTAAQMTSLQQTAMGGGSTTAKTTSYTLVAADAGTVIQMNSASATTITVNTGLFAAGDTVQIQNIGAGICTVTAGTATVNTAGSLALSQYEGGQLYFNTTGAALFFDVVQASSAGGGMTLLSTTTLSGTSTAITGISGAYNNLFVVLSGITGATAGEFRINGDTTGIYASIFTMLATTTTSAIDNGTLRWNAGAARAGDITQTYTIYNYASTSTLKPVSQVGGFMATSNGVSNSALGFKNTTSAITSITVTSDGASFTAGTVLIYGVK